MSLRDKTDRVESTANAVSQRLLNERVFPYLLIAGAAVWLAVIYAYPLARTIYYSFFEVSLLQQSSREFVGLENYQDALTGPFVDTLVRTGIWTFGSVIPAILLGMFGAILLNREFPGRRWALGIALIPWTMPLAIVGFIWSMMYHPQIGFLTIFFEDYLNMSISFLGYDNALKSVIIARVWRATPFAMIIIYARLQSIPDHLYESAKIDGAGRWEQFRYITLPELSRVVMIALIMLTVWTTLVFDIIWAMTQGGPINATTIIPIDIYDTVFSSYELGLAGAKSVITVVLLLVVTTVYWKYSDL
jgi:multiple sugar transport system permease protein